MLLLRVFNRVCVLNRVCVFDPVPVFDLVRVFSCVFNRFFGRVFDCVVGPDVTSNWTRDVACYWTRDLARDWTYDFALDYVLDDFVFVFRFRNGFSLDRLSRRRDTFDSFDWCLKDELRGLDFSFCLGFDFWFGRT